MTDLYSDLLAEAERLTGQTVMRPYINIETIAYCRNCPPDVDHWMIELPGGVMGWRHLDDGGIVPVRTRYCAIDAATGWLAGFVWYWHYEHGTGDADLLARARKLNHDKRYHVAQGFNAGVYGYGRWDWEPSQNYRM